MRIGRAVACTGKALAGLAAGVLASSLAPAAAAQPASPRPAPAASPATPTAPADVCLTNACSPRTAGPAPINYPRDEAKVAAAIRAGKAGDLVLAGGTPNEVAEVMRANCAQISQRTCDALPANARFSFGRFTTGMIGLMSVRDGPDPASPVTGMVMVLMGAGLEGILAPDSVPQNRQPTSGVLATARPNTEPFTTPEGGRGARVVSWTLSTGEVVSPEELGNRVRAESGAPPPRP